MRAIVTNKKKKKISGEEVKEERQKDWLEEVNGQPLSPAARLFHQPHLNCYIITILGGTTRVDPNVVKAGLQATLLRHPRFSSIQTINDVALGITQAGLSRYLNRRYSKEKRDEQATEGRNNLPKKNRLRAALLVNIRPSPGIQALADMMEKDKTDCKWGNRIGYVLLPFTIALRDDPLDYVREAKAIIDRKKHSYEAIYSFISCQLVVKLFGFKVTDLLLDTSP
ncbi:hypothetical protein NE237_028443 [Protea cynaroides]|uniref:O-acyltransferase WSD1 C-terminal domain-containing protein n=1 Tax=Protea cynaroides TaxID=273540 RepID=A0A9Q0GR67_9MAGN|nr:hypothetical protein NE237_028443 [Protea cynaroides]